ncbi:hypothetical protein BgiBS90_035400 [Biomphalaria glabrata]|nr:hypothetical protein BgiBS90_035400 [Biomphalaria glabrata]
MECVLYEVAVLTPYTTNKTFPTLGRRCDHDVITQKNDNDLHSGDTSEPKCSGNDNKGREPQREKWQELPSYIRSVEGSDYTMSTVSSLALSSDPCLSDASWGNRELCSTKYDHDDFEGISFIPITETDHIQELTKSLPGDTGIGLSLSNVGFQLCQDTATPMLQNLMADLVRDVSTLNPLEETSENSSAQINPFESGLGQGTTEVGLHHLIRSDQSLESNPFISAMSHFSEDDYFTSVASHFDHDDDSSSAFSSCRVSRASSQCDLNEASKTHLDQLNPEGTAKRIRKLLPTVKSTTPMPTMFTPPPGKEGRKLNTLLSLDLESCKSYETCYSSGYCDSPTASSVFSDFSEFSCLNPLSKPFVPRSWTSDAASCETNSTNAMKNQTLNIHSLVLDSGIEQTKLIGSIQNNVDSQAEVSASKAHEAFSHVCEDILTEQTGPCLCNISHTDEFTPMHEFTLSTLPEGCRSIETLESIKSISQRVVKLCVRKPFSLCHEGTPNLTSNSVQSEDLGNAFDHYGTGFVFDVDTKSVHIRTHCKVVGSSDEASQTQVYFSMFIGQNVLTAKSSGQSDGFVLKPHSECTVFTCKTPPELRDHLIALKDVPVLTRTSLFNDSCYFSDISTDSNISDHEDTSVEQLAPTTASTISHVASGKHLTYADIVSCKNSKSVHEGIDDNARTGQDHSQEPSLISLDHIKESSNDAMKNPINALRSLSPLDPRVRKAFESVPETAPGTPSYRVDTPLNICERALESFKTGTCPYAGERTFGSNCHYTYFSNVTDALFPYSAKGNTNPWSNSWDYEYLVYAQNHRRDSYNMANSCNKRHNFASSDGGISSIEPNCHQNSTHTSDHSTGSQETSTAHKDFESIFRELTSRDAFIASWDRNLLNLDDNLNPLPPYDPCTNCPQCAETDVGRATENVDDTPQDFLEQLVSDILRDDIDHSRKSDEPKVRNACCQKSYFPSQRTSHNTVVHFKPSYALIISYPHGGPKMVSLGQFSRHHHTGGDLYDTPTCMGSCGAPVLALSEDHSGPIVTYLVHGGTVRQNGIYTGIGFTSFI